ncbi:hypothetical protein PC116_g9662 [Phytophthora cactorum]|uniref:Uncharacterized protein n=1 Tax=Phytophthora cactorum TaxID=29920 RepID=A0A8T0ZK81_9STRA|nr:hypothetical protein PC112_g6745 [Phytophthora cactorum]KAG2835319.1 hypothetical protein PC111_g5490 [Phytophthora cactorum]KAG2862921.1 hypothetical protein PC113_g5881 [Phytophthora cactorum]KAG2918344.1 hypothetical protein PC114_g6873 [Phytophthora cactorum]KAG2947527.1 hypothetical protein PC117_g6768 [Phytophthora cactorum]
MAQQTFPTLLRTKYKVAASSTRPRFRRRGGQASARLLVTTPICPSEIELQWLSTTSLTVAVHTMPVRSLVPGKPKRYFIFARLYKW